MNETTTRDYLADNLEAADEIIEEAIRALVDEAGGPNPHRPRHEEDALVEAFMRRVKRSPRLDQALIDRQVCSAMIAYELVKGYEPVPGDYGKSRPRAGGPLPLAEQRRVALERGITLEELEDTRAADREAARREQRREQRRRRGR